MRNTVYDNMGAAITNLKLTTTIADNSIMKSKDAEKGDLSSLEQFVEADKASDALCSFIYNCFVALRNDHNSNAINGARYMANLRPLKEFLDGNPKINNACLNRKEILDEANLYL
jgi:hypothetical protein